MSSIIRRHDSSGYTLIELLLIISIIGLLVSVLMTNLLESRQNSRDAAMKQMVRTTATLFEFTRNELGNYVHYDIGGIGNDGTAATCNDVSWQGPYMDRLERLCEGIVNNAEYTSNLVLFYLVDPTLQDGNNFSISLQLHNGNWYCVGSNGGSSETPGPYDPNARGCAANP